ncbi:Fc.00g037010.m01.CDS01 [Cosmosporella sp. VM-42]
MAPPSPRRSSRARATNSQSQQSSGASSTSGRLERSTRSVNKPSSTKSTPSASLSSEPLEDLDDTLLGRRRKRGQDDDSDKISRIDNLDMPNGSDDLQEEEDEAVRCICGSEDYPGRPPVDGPDADFFAAIELTEDVTGFFVQCDVCKVWQHGACVGIFSAESSPDEYFCEQCRKDLHKIHIASNGQKYSKYVPLHRPSRSTSRAASIVKEGTRSPKAGGGKNSRPTSASQAAAAKRRSTMNSRDRAYDDEQLRRAIEASKEDAPLDAPEGAPRRPKRGRSDSEESVAVEGQPQGEKVISLRNVPSVKRQRTSSRSPSPPPVEPVMPVKPVEVPSREESDGETDARNGLKKARNGKNQREKTEKEDKERQRQEAATKRKGRAERRRGEDSDPSEEAITITAPPATKSAEPPTPVVVEPPPPVPEPVPDTPPPAHPPPASSHKRGGRGHHKRGKGRNQYTRDRDGDHSHSPARSMSRDVQRNGDESATTGHSKSSTDHKHGSRSKSSMATKLSMLDMKRRVGAIMDFISRTQVDLAAEALPVPTTSSGQSSPEKIPVPQVNGNSEKQADTTDNAATTPESTNAREFKDLNCMEMMDILTRDMVKWQNQYA